MTTIAKPTLVITRGYPGSGKSTLARQWVAEDPEGRVRLNRDDFRHMMFDKSWGLSHTQENAVTASQKSAARAHLRAGRSVIIDDTNLRLRTARGWADLAVQVGATLDVRDLHTPADQCVEHDTDRGHAVGEDVIRTFAQKFPMPWPTVQPSERQAETPPAHYVPDITKPRAWIVDIDGTLAHMVDRGPYDLDRVGEDELDTVVYNLVNTIQWHGDAIILVSGREDSCRDETERWLDKYEVPFTALFMRKAEDKRPDYKVKAEIFDAHIRDNWHIVGVFDDRNQVVNMWRSIGLKTLQVAEGNF